jgi:hypothetical protein
MLPLYAAAIFVSAALLFMVQPMVARMVLPVLGGSPAVWNTAMVFFQAVLLGGYIYAHLLTRHLRPRTQLIVHAIVLLLPLLALPIALPSWTPPATRSPALWMLLVMVVSVGLPFFVVSTSGPLLQRWFSRTGHASAKDPYFLYAASNVGSLLALLGYPFVIEPVIGLRVQTVVWTAGYVAFVVFAMACGVVMARRAGSTPEETEDVADSTPPAPVTWRRRLMWVLLAFVPSSLMLGVTQHVSTDIASAPLLWVIPLSIYLLTFVMAFSTRLAPSVTSIGKLFPMIACAIAVAFMLHARQPGIVLILMHLMLLLLAGLLCHTRLAADRPATTHLTEFYLLVAVGGVFGGIFNALIAPMIFSGLFEYPIAIVLGAMLLPRRAPKAGRRSLILDLVIPVLVLGLTFALATVLEEWRIAGPAVVVVRYGLPVLLCYLTSKDPLRFALTLAGLLFYAETMVGQRMRVVYSERTFFGQYRILEEFSLGRNFRRFRLTHGTTTHGIQSSNPTTALEPTSYYTRMGPLGPAMDLIQNGAGPQRAGLIGLGIGTIASYARPGDHYTFFEIDPAIIDIANDRRFFSYLRNAESRGVTIDHEIGDARLTLAKEPDGTFDFIIVDAFSSDAIPIHLLTTQAMTLYASKLAPGGVICLHISNRYLDLEPVVAAIVDDVGLSALIRADERPILNDPRAPSLSTWVVIARPDTDITPLFETNGDIPGEWWRFLDRRPGLRAWTDDYANIIGAYVWAWPTRGADNAPDAETDLPDGG